MGNSQKLQKFNAAATTSLNIIFVLILLFVLGIFAMTVYIYFYLKDKVERSLKIIEHTEKELRRAFAALPWNPFV